MISKEFRLLVAAVLFCAGCDVFLTPRGAAGQACFESGQNGVCNEGLTCCSDFVCRSSCEDEEETAGDDGGMDAGETADGEEQITDSDDGGFSDADDEPLLDEDDGQDLDDGEPWLGEDVGQDLDDGGTMEDSGFPDGGEVTEDQQDHECDRDSDCEGSPPSLFGVCYNHTCHEFAFNGAGEMCTDGYDNDGDGDVDFGDTDCGQGEDCFDDGDKDGYAANTCGGKDLDDTLASVNPGVIEFGSVICNNNVDDDCDGNTDATDPSCSEFSFQGNLSDVWVYNGDFAALAGTDLVVFVWNGDEWNSLTTSFAASRVWSYRTHAGLIIYAVDTGGKAWIKSPQTGFSEIIGLERFSLKDVWGAHTNRIFAAGCDDSSYPALVHYDGLLWNEVDLRGTLGSALDGYCATRVFGRGFHVVYVLAAKDGEVPKVISVRDGETAPREVSLLEIEINGLPYVFDATALWVDHLGRAWVGGSKDGDVKLVLCDFVKGSASLRDVGRLTAGRTFFVNDLFGFRAENGLEMFVAAGDLIYRVACHDTDCASNTIDQEVVGDGTNSFRAIGGSHPYDTWAVGDQGILIHRDTADCADQVANGCPGWRYYNP